MQPEPEPANITLYVVILFVLIILSAFFSATETAYSAANRVRLKVKANDGGKNAKRAYALSEKFDRVLLTLLIGNNIVNITATTIATLIAIEIWNAQIGPTISTIVLTIIILIFGEIFPKMLAKQAPEAFAIAASPILKFFIIILYPLCSIFAGLKYIVSKIMKSKPDEGLTDDELKTMVEEASEDGTIENSESELISNAIDFHDCEVGDILIPRVNIIAVPVNMEMAQIKKVFFKNTYSRLPVYDGTIDKIIGMIHEKDFLTSYEKGDKDIRGIIKNTALASEHMRISTLLKTMQKSKVHLAVVVDEYGGTLGIVTLEDILEELVGEIWDEHDEVVEYFEKIDEKTYRVDGNATLEDFFDLFNLSHDSDDFDSQTVGGWVVEKFGNLPKRNDSFEFENLKISVTRCSQRRVFEIKVKIIELDEDDDKEKEHDKDKKQKD